MEEKIAKYHKIIVDFLKEQASFRKATSSSEIQLIIDEPNRHYQLLRMGWKNGKFTHLCLFHFDLKNDKIWIQQNRTDIDVADFFIENGVNPNDIVLGFLPSELRNYTNLVAA